MYITADEFYKRFIQHVISKFEKNKTDFFNAYTNACTEPFEKEIEKSKDTEIDTPVEKRKKKLMDSVLR